MARLGDQRASATLLFFLSAGVRDVLHYGDLNSCPHTFASSSLTTERILIRSCSEGFNLSNVCQLIRVLKQVFRGARTLEKTHQAEQQFWHSNYGGRLLPQTNRHHRKMPILLLIFSGTRNSWRGERRRFFISKRSPNYFGDWERENIPRK